jgi:hypothetical protein
VLSDPEVGRCKRTGSSDLVNGGLKGLMNPFTSRYDICITYGAKEFDYVVSISTMSTGPVGTKVSV